jgi:hypothetical protein
MFNRGSLIFPDTGKAFLRTLRQATFYCEDVHVMTLVDSDVVHMWAGAIREGIARAEALVPEGRSLLDQNIARILSYLDFVYDNRSELAAAQTAGVLRPLFNKETLAASYTAMMDAGRQLKPRFEAAPRAAQEAISSYLEGPGHSRPPALADLMTLYVMFLGSWLHDHGDRDASDFVRENVIKNPLAWHVDSYATYLLFVATYCAEHGLPVTSWDSSHLNAVRACSALLDDDEGIRAQREAESLLGQLVIERYIPHVADLQMDVLLELRSERQPELASLRSAVATLATSLDPKQPMNRLERDAYVLTAQHIDPALRALTAAVSSSRLRVLQRSRDAIIEGAPKIIPATISFALGAPFNVSAALAVFGALSAVIDQVAEHRRMRHASEWSVLLDLRRTVDAKVP